MIQVFPFIFDKTKEPIRGLIHVGGHFGQEIDFYRSIGISRLLVYEPIPHIFEVLNTNHGVYATCVQKAVGNINGSIEMNVEQSNAGQSSSVLKPKQHLIEYPQIQFDQQITVPIVRLDDDVTFPQDYDALVVDVQGYELEVFKGAAKMLNQNIRVIVSEVNFDEMYEGCARVADLDAYLLQFGFKRILTQWEKPSWGNALYLKC